MPFKTGFEFERISDRSPIHASFPLYPSLPLNLFLACKFSKLELARRGQRWAQRWGLRVELVRAQLSVSAAGPWSKPVPAYADVSPNRRGRSKLPWRFPAATETLRGKR